MPSLTTHCAILETIDASTLEHLLASGVGRFVVRQLAPTVVVVDHGRLAELRRHLKQLGQTPRITIE